ncbi:MBG domain-containing protein [Pseudotenacibaculum haliotis]|uniref:MBG domain-containing protein n=1 Tax=Pseudotenacibaculum haliotis TaxID=1862138 RepID=A0ABW5LX24_9FLAO
MKRTLFNIILFLFVFHFSREANSQTIVNNLSESINSSYTIGGSGHEQSFTVGNQNVKFYSVMLDFESGMTDPASVNVSLRTNAGSTIENLGNHFTGSGLQGAIESSTNPTLLANTTYKIHVSISSGTNASWKKTVSGSSIGTLGTFPADTEYARMQVLGLITGNEIVSFPTDPYGGGYDTDGTEQVNTINFGNITFKTTDDGIGTAFASLTGIAGALNRGFAHGSIVSGNSIVDGLGYVSNAGDGANGVWFVFSTDNGSEFNFSGFDAFETYDYIQTIEVLGFRDGTLVVSEEVSIAKSSIYNYIRMTDTGFRYVDEVRIRQKTPGFFDGGVPGIEGFIFNNIVLEAPVLPNAAPTASNVNFTGGLASAEQLSGSYTWNDTDAGDTESGTTFQWYRSDNNSGTNRTAISGATGQNYTLTNNDIGKYISFEVTPNDGTDAGTPVESSLQGPVTACLITAVNCNPGFTGHQAFFQLGIKRVIFGTIDNTTSVPGQGDPTLHDFTCTQQTTITAGVPQSITVTNFTHNQEDVKVYIDYNNDGDFNDAGELAFSSDKKISHTGSITAPLTAVNNTVLRMRVLSDFFDNGVASACENIDFGQVEEYGVTVLVPVITGTSANQAVNDDTTIDPFSGVVLTILGNPNVTATITLDNNAKGALSGADLVGSGPYTIASKSLADMQAAIRALTFTPTANRTATTETTAFTITIDDGTTVSNDSNTTVISSAVGPTITGVSIPNTPMKVGDVVTATITVDSDTDNYTSGSGGISGTIGGFSVGNLSRTNATTYTATFTVTDGGTDVAAGSDIPVSVTLSDSGGKAGNTFGTAISQSSDAIDANRPDVDSIVITDSALISGETTLVTFTFSEVVTGFTNADITIPNGTLTNVSSADGGTTYTATFTPTSSVEDATNVFTIDKSGVADNAGNLGAGTTDSGNFTIDTQKPTVTITSSADPTSGAFTATFTFSEDVTGFVVGDITVGNGAASNFNSTSASVYTATITPIADGAVTIDVAADKAIDVAGNNNTAATQLSVENDETKPTVTITSTNTSGVALAEFPVTFTFSESVTGFVEGDITLSNGTVKAGTFSGTGTTYTATISGTNHGTVTIDVASDVANDAAGNGNTAATQFSIENDIISPSLTITSNASNPQSGAFTATFTFDEDVTGFVVGDITVGNGAASNFQTTSAKVYTATITPASDGAVTIDVTFSIATDIAGNFNNSATQLSVTNDETKPSVVITSSANPVNGAFTATFTFSEDVTGFVIGDITVGNGAASNFNSTSANVYTATITPAAEGAVTIDVAADKAIDAAGNDNLAATQLSITNDTSKPTVTITSNAASSQSGAFTATFTFSEDVTGFVVGDITVGNGTASNFNSTSASVYTATITPASDGAVTVDVAIDKANDTAGNGNIAATQLSVSNDETSSSVLEINSDATNGTYGVGDVINIYVQYDEEVFVTGTPQLTLETGTTDQTINYVDRSVSTLRFVYTVQSGDENANLDVINSSALTLNSGTIKDAAGNDANLTVPHGVTSGSLSLNKAIVINASVPTVTTTDVASIAQLSADFGGNVTDGGGSTVTDRGIVYSITSANNNPEIGGTGVTKDDNGAGTGAFNESITGLLPNTQYSYRAYATNNSGTVYGSVKTFTTLALIAPTISFTDINKTYGDADFTLAATSNSGGTITYSIIGATNGTSLSGSNDATVDLGNVANITIRATLVANGIYTGGTKDITLAIAARSIAVTADVDQTKVYGDSDPTFTYTITTGSLVSGDSFTGALTRAAGAAVGNYAINQGTLSAGTNYNLSFVSNDFSITQKAITITADAGQTKVYGEIDPTFAYAVTSGSLVSGDSFTGALNRAAGEDVGDYAINQGTLSAGTNYNLSFVSNDFSITQKAITVTADAGQTKIYGEADPTFAYSITTGSLETGDSFTGALTRAAGEDVGNYAINQGTLSAGTNYNLSYVSNDFSIAQKAITVTADAGQTKIYGEADPTFAYAVTSGSLETGDSFTGALTRATGEAVGNYAINQGTLSAGTNYNLSYVSNDFSIAQKAIIVTADVGQTKIYGETDPTYTYAITTGSLVSGDSFTGTLDRAAGEDVGTYAISQGTLSAGANYNLSFVSNDFAIAQRDIIVTADTGQTKVYGDTDPSFTYAITTGTLVSGDSFTGALTRATGEDVGNYTISQGTLSLNSNYNLSFVSNDFSITQKAITVTADDQLKERGTADPAFTYVLTSGSLESGDSFSGTLSRIAGEDAGTYAITQGTLTAGPNYNLTFIEGTLTIEDTIAPVSPQVTHISEYTCSGNLTMTSDNTLKISGTAERGSTVEVFIEAISVGTTITDDNGFFTFDHTGTTLADGTYSITAQATDVSGNTGDLSAPFTITINTVDTDSDGIADFCDEDDDGNGVDDVDEDCDGDGIIDSQDTDNSACTSEILQTRSYGFSPNGDGVNDGWVIENITAFPNNTVSVYSRSGKLVFKKKGYQNDWEAVSNQISNSGSSNRLPVGPYIYVIDLGDGSKPTRGWLYINY